MSFAGRLDPMAHGKMIILVNDECKKQDLYCKNNKIYEFEILLGISTDTYDILGKILNYNLDILDYNLNINFKGKYLQEYPPYSSIVVNKKPLWYWAKNNLLENIIIPKKEIEIYNFKKISEKIISNRDLLELVKSKIDKLSNISKKNFRVNEIIELWNSLLDKENDFNLKIYKYRSHVSSGCYIRKIVNEIEKIIGLPCCTLDIKRTHIDMSL